MQDLRSPVLDDLGLAAAIRSYAQSTLEGAGIELRFSATGFDQRLGPSIETALFRIIQEAVHNIVKHSGAKVVSIEMYRIHDKVSLVVKDNGKGFETGGHGYQAQPGHALGLLGMKERVTLIGGSFSVKSELGKGTRIEVEAPVEH